MTVGDENSIKLQKAICLQKLYVVTFYYQGHVSPRIKMHKLKKQIKIRFLSKQSSWATETWLNAKKTT